MVVMLYSAMLLHVSTVKYRLAGMVCVWDVYGCAVSAVRQLLSIGNEGGRTGQAFFSLFDSSGCWSPMN